MGDKKVAGAVQQKESLGNREEGLFSRNLRFVKTDDNIVENHNLMIDKSYVVGFEAGAGHG